MDPEAERLARLYERNVDEVFRYASRLTGGDRAAAEELVQETFLAVFQRATGTNSTRSGSRPVDESAVQPEITTGYLIVACRHRFFDSVRAAHRRERREQLASTARMQPTSDVPPDPIATAALAALPSDQRAALVLRYVDDCSVAEVAAQLGRSVRATESLLARARTALRNELTGGTPR